MPVDEPVIPGTCARFLHGVVNLKVVRHQLAPYFVIFCGVGTILLNHYDIDMHSSQVKGVEDLELSSFHVQAEEIDVRDAKGLENGTQGYAGHDFGTLWHDIYSAVPELPEAF